MNDRYLYKAKRIDNGEWVEGFLHLVNDVPYILQHYNTGQPIHVDNLKSTAVEVQENTICQCTALKDRNGKLIYENDILCGHLDEDLPEDTTYEKVVWRNSGFCTHQEGSCDYEPLDDFITQNFEACGNIFDNPEFLEAGKEAGEQGNQGIGRNSTVPGNRNDRRIRRG